MTTTAATADRPVDGPSRASSIINDSFARAVFYQLLTAAILVGGIWYLVSNTIENMSQRGMAAGFDFLDYTAGFNIVFTLIPYREGDSYLRVFQVGVANTLLVSAIGIVLATVIGLLMGPRLLPASWTGWLASDLTDAGIARKAWLAAALLVVLAGFLARAAAARYSSLDSGESSPAVSSPSSSPNSEPDSGDS